MYVLHLIAVGSRPLFVANRDSSLRQALHKQPERDSVKESCLDAIWLRIHSHPLPAQCLQLPSRLPIGLEVDA